MAEITLAGQLANLHLASEDEVDGLNPASGASAFCKGKAFAYRKAEELVRAQTPAPAPADVASEAVERRLISLLEEAEGRNPAIPLKVAGPAIRLLLSDYKARGEEIERLKGEVRMLGEMPNTCTYQVLRERRDNCRCDLRDQPGDTP